MERAVLELTWNVNNDQKECHKKNSNVLLVFSTAFSKPLANLRPLHSILMQTSYVFNIRRRSPVIDVKSRLSRYKVKLCNHGAMMPTPTAASDIRVRIQPT